MGWAVATTSCGAYLGPAAVVPLAQSTASAGVEGGYSVFPTGSEGPVLGGGAMIAPPEEGANRQARGWADLTLGYGVQPVPQGSHLGIELKAGPAAGILPDAGGYPLSLGWVFELDALYRISPTHRAWELGDHAMTYGVLMLPTVQLAQLVPLGEGHDHVVVSTLVIGAAFRFDSWLAVLP